ncbi:MAG: dihydropyrimidinase [Candidatus Marinimicrobia bacterium]|nr:dihydropyrimidinase [Candidatus Neomarinimicrobiota bacterium]
MSTLIKNAKLINADGSLDADILIDNEIIVKVGESIEDNADRIIDASGKYVIPGGIDVHTHLDMPFGGTVSSDNFETGHIAAAHGGTTCHIDFIIQGKGQSLAEAIDIWHGKAEGKACVDYGFHMAITDMTDSVMEELPTLVHAGISTIKLFMAYKNVLQVDDETLFKSLQIAGDNGILTCVHAENGDAIDVLIKQMLAEGKTDPIYHAKSRPHWAEAEATSRAIHLAAIADAPLFVVHLTCASALEQIKIARAKGLKAMAETCVQYLFRTEKDLARPGFEGAKYVCSPPLRTEEDQKALWDGLINGDLASISTDHCTFNYVGQKDLGKGDFSLIPNGLPGIEDRMMVMHHHGVGGGKFSLERWVEITSTNPAKTFGMYPRKGVIRENSDADLVIWDPEKEHTISAETHHMNIDYNIYEGMEVKGMPEIVFSSGRIVVEDGEFKGKVGAGNFVRREAIEGVI